jgi:hypothetical protein
MKGQHVTILKKGLAAWNAWRDENPDIRQDLSGRRDQIDGWAHNPQSIADQPS